MTQAPATPELAWDQAVEKVRKAIYDDGRGMNGRNRNYLAYRVARAILVERKEAADALEAQQARIAELEFIVARFDRIHANAESAQALADRYEKALREIQDLPYSATPGRFSSDIARQALSSSQGRHEGGGE